MGPIPVNEWNLRLLGALARSQLLRPHGPDLTGQQHGGVGARQHADDQREA